MYLVGICLRETDMRTRTIHHSICGSRKRGEVDMQEQGGRVDELWSGAGIKERFVTVDGK